MNVRRLRAVPDLPLVNRPQRQEVATYAPPPLVHVGVNGERVRRPRIYLGPPTATYDYPDARGRVLLRKVRFAPPGGEPKQFRMYACVREGHVWIRPRDVIGNHPTGGWCPTGDWSQYFASLLYRLPELLAALRDPAHAPVWWTAGEKDCDALRALGVVATTHWQGESVGASELQAEHFRGWRGGVVLVADRDTTGAFDVVRRFDLLRAVGLPARHLRIVVGRVEGKGADAFDHIADGGGLADFVPISIDRARESAARSSAQRRAYDGYGWSR